MPETVIHRNVVILPPEEIMQQAVALSEDISKQHATNFTLNLDDRLPHLTLHQFAIPEKHEERLEELVHEIAGKHTPTSVTLEDFGVFGGSGLFWNAKKTEALWQLHRDLVSQIVPLQEEYIIDQHASFLTGEADVDATKRRSLHLYGNPLANPESMDPPFWPHVTITSCESREVASKLAEELPQESVTFEVPEIHIAGVGPSGTCPNVFFSIPLSS